MSKLIPEYLLAMPYDQARADCIEHYVHDAARKEPDEFYEIEIEEPAEPPKWHEVPWPIFRSCMSRIRRIKPD